MPAESARSCRVSSFLPKVREGSDNWQDGRWMDRQKWQELTAVLFFFLFFFSFSFFSLSSFFCKIQWSLSQSTCPEASRTRAKYMDPTVWSCLPHLAAQEAIGRGSGDPGDPGDPRDVCLSW